MAQLKSACKFIKYYLGLNVVKLCSFLLVSHSSNGRKRVHISAVKFAACF